MALPLDEAEDAVVSGELALRATTESTAAAFWLTYLITRGRYVEALGEYKRLERVLSDRAASGPGGLAIVMANVELLLPGVQRQLAALVTERRDAMIATDVAQRGEWAALPRAAARAGAGRRTTRVRA